MSWEHFEDTCAGCRPAAMDASTGKVLGAEHPIMRAINLVWEGTTREEREAFHRFTCQNSRDQKVLAAVMGINMRIQAALKP